MKFTEKLFRRLVPAYQITVLTGAGISAESGIPTFRDKDGLWNKHDVQKLATHQALHNDPELFWQFYKWRRELLKDVKPNLGHYALVDLESRYEGFSLITQNVDNLHWDAGNKRVLELHGNIKRTRCDSCHHILNAEEEKNVTAPIPKCPKCGELLRPDVVLFGESLPPKALADAQEAAATCELFFSIGTSSLVEPAASLPYIAKANGAYIVEINIDRTPLSDHADEVLIGKAGEILPQIVMILERFQK